MLPVESLQVLEKKPISNILVVYPSKPTLTVDNYYKPCDFSKIVGYAHDIPEKAIDKLPFFKETMLQVLKPTSEISIYVLQDGVWHTTMKM